MATRAPINFTTVDDVRCVYRGPYGGTRRWVNPEHKTEAALYGGRVQDEELNEYQCVVALATLLANPDVLFLGEDGRYAYVELENEYIGVYFADGVEVEYLT